MTAETEPAALFAAAAAASADGDVEGALEVLSRAARLLPENAEVRLQTGHLKNAAGDLEGALAAYREACVLAPQSAAAQNFVGLTLKAMNRLEDSARCLREAAGRFPERPELLYNLGNTLSAARRPEDAAAAYEKTLEADPGHFKARVHLAFALLTMGRWREGFAAYESRFQAPGFPLPPFTPETPPWAGDNLHGRRILLIAEQGFGDVVQFIRYAPMVKARGGTVIVACPPQMTGLLQGQPGVDEVLPQSESGGGGGAGAPFDTHAFLMSLPHIFKTAPETVPADFPYLHVPPEARRRAADPNLAGPGFKAGLVWRAGYMSPTGAQRSLPPEAAAALLEETPGVRWFGLDVRAESDPRPDADLSAGGAGGAGIVDLGPRIKPFADTAAAAAAMDVVVTVDTAMAHLAGALGKRTFVLLPYAADWRWGAEGGTSLWYPAARLFRQEAPGDWSAPAAACKAALREAAAAENI